MKPHRLLTAALAIALAVPASGLAQQTAERLYQEGLYQEEVQGDLRNAITLFERILSEFPNARPVAANALMHIGLCQEKLGSAEAQRAYDRLLRDYGDQTEVAAQARARLADLRGLARAERPSEPAGPVARMLLKADRGCLISLANPSPDGTRVAYNDYCTDGAIHIRDLRSGETRRVTGPGVFAGKPVWSPDGSRIAIADLSAGRDGFPSPLQIIDLESGEVEMPAALNDMWHVNDWSPDGEWIAGEIGGDPVIASLETGEVVPLGLGGVDFSADGRYVAFVDNVAGSRDIWIMEVGSRVRRRATTDPGAEGGPRWSPDGRTLVYVSKRNLWAIDLANGRPNGQPRLVRTGGGGLAAWTEHGAYYYGSSTLVSAYRIPVDPATAEPTGDPERMPELDDFEWFAWSPDMQQIAAVPRQGGDRQHMLLKRGGYVTPLPFGGTYRVSNLWWTPDGREIQFNATEQNDRRQTVFGVDPTDGTVRELFPGRDSIHNIHVSPNGTHMAFLRGPRFVGPNELVVSDIGDPDSGRVLASDTDPEGQIRPMLPLFSPDGSQILFVRRRAMYVIPSDGSGPARLITTLPILITRATWDPSGRFIAFLEKDFDAATETIWVVSVETGIKRQVRPSSPMSRTLQLRTWSPDGKWIVFHQEIGSSEFWVTEDLLGERRRAP